MAASNENVPTSVDSEVSTLGVYAVGTPPEDEISDEDMGDLPSAAKIVAAPIVVTTLSDSLPRVFVDTSRIFFSLLDKGKALASSVVANPFVPYMEDASSSSARPNQVAVDNDKDCFGKATAEALQLSLSLVLEGSDVHKSI
jgi:hypothetical protein